eukprot:3621291-Rhodomonas_salina.2
MPGTNGPGVFVVAYARYWAACRGDTGRVIPAVQNSPSSTLPSCRGKGREGWREGGMEGGMEGGREGER